MRDFASPYFLIRHTFCMWNFVSLNEAQLALLLETKFRMQKCNTRRDTEI
jgi:hypothetical protein